MNIAYMLNIDNVYLFSSAEERGGFRSQVVNKNITEDYLFSSFNADEVIDFEWYQGATKYDVIPTCYTEIFLVSKKIKSLLSDSSIKGYNLRYIFLKDKRKRQ